MSCRKTLKGSFLAYLTSVWTQLLVLMFFKHPLRSFSLLIVNDPFMFRKAKQKFAVGLEIEEYSKSTITARLFIRAWTRGGHQQSKCSLILQSTWIYVYDIQWRRWSRLRIEVVSLNQSVREYSLVHCKRQASYKLVDIYLNNS